MVYLLIFITHSVLSIHIHISSAVLHDLFTPLLIISQSVQSIAESYLSNPYFIFHFN